MGCDVCPNGQVGWDEFLPYVMPYVQSVPDELAAHHIRVATIHFLRETGFLKVDLYKNLEEDVSHYVLDLPDGYIPRAIRRVRVNDYEYTGQSEWDTCMPSCRYHYRAPCELYISPAGGLDVTDGIHVEMKVVPGQDSCFVDRSVYDNYAQVIADKAIYSLLMIPNVPSYDPRRAAIHNRDYKAGLSAAKKDVVRGQNHEPKRMRTPNFI